MLIYKLMGDQAQQQFARACPAVPTACIKCLLVLICALFLPIPQEAGAFHMVRARLSLMDTAALQLSSSSMQA